MPNYQFECKKCGHRFELTETIGDHDKHEEKCPECGSKDVAAVLTPVNVRTRKKS